MHYCPHSGGGWHTGHVCEVVTANPIPQPDAELTLDGALERLVVMTAMHDAELAIRCEAVVKDRLSALVEENTAHRERIAQWMITNSLPTGHGDTVEDLLEEASWQIKEWVGRLVAAEARAQRAEEALTKLHQHLGAGKFVNVSGARKILQEAGLSAALDASEAKE